ncbi:MAG TPA: MASE3 domain-containing protein [Azospirillum sp.]|nr:MASE3 domain-containing protein [Azospirillum sp.]
MVQFSTADATESRRAPIAWAREVALLCGTMAMLFFGMRYNYLLFHTIAELFSIVVATATFMIAWNTRHTNQSPFLAFIGLSFPAVAAIDLLHTIAFPGMNVFPVTGANLATQLWLAARYVQAGNFLVAPLLLPNGRVSTAVVLGLQAVLFSTSVLMTVTFDVMPAAYINGYGLTAFKIASEYAVSGVVALGCLALIARRRHLDPSVFTLSLGGIALVIPQEMAFTLYHDPHGLMNALGHFCKILSYYLLYKAVVVTALKHPYDLLFYRLCRSEQALRDHLGGLEAIVETRTAELRESEARWRALLECSNDWFWEADATGRFVELSPNAEESTGRPAAELLGKSYADLLDAGRAPEDFAELTEELRNRRPFRRLIIPLATPTVAGRWISVSGVPRFAPDGRFIGYRGTASDITDRRRAGEAVRQKRTMAALGSLVGGLAHEINNLLQPVISLSELALPRAGNDAKLHTYLTAIHDSGLKARTILRDVLAFARSEVADSPPGDIGESVRSAVQLILPSLPAGIMVQTRIADGLPPVTITATELSQVLLNLIQNARDAMPGGGVLSLSAETVSLRDPEAARLEIPEGVYVHLSVTDTGAGMDEATRHRVFEPFFTTKPVGLGTGLGLSVVYGIVRNGGGVISVDSALGRGTTVDIDLPAATERSEENDEEIVHGEGVGG